MEARLFQELSKDYILDTEIINMLNDENYRNETLMQALELSNHEQNPYMALLYFSFFKHFNVEVLENVIGLFDHESFWYKNFIKKYFELCLNNNSEDILDILLTLDVNFNYSIFKNNPNDKFLIKCIKNNKIILDEKIFNTEHYNYFLQNMSFENKNLINFLFYYITSNKDIHKIIEYLLNDEILFELINKNIFKEINYKYTLKEIVNINIKFINSDQARQNEYYPDIIILWHTIPKYKEIYQISKEDLINYCIKLIENNRIANLKILVNQEYKIIDSKRIAYYSAKYKNLEMLEFMLNIVPLDNILIKICVMTKDDNIYNFIIKKLKDFENLRDALIGAISVGNYKVISDIISRNVKFMEDDEYVYRAISIYDPFRPDTRNTIIELLKIYGYKEEYLELIKQKDPELFDTIFIE